MKNNVVIVAVLTAVVFGAGGYVAGKGSSQSQSGVTPTTQLAGGVRAGRGAGRGLGGGTSGKIISQDSNSITVQGQDGSSKIVNLTSSTVISKMSPATMTDLTTGEQVIIFGQSQSDGSIDAQRVQLNPMKPLASGNPSPTNQPSRPTNQ